MSLHVLVKKTTYLKKGKREALLQDIEDQHLQLLLLSLLKFVKKIKLLTDSMKEVHHISILTVRFKVWMELRFLTMMNKKLIPKNSRSGLSNLPL